METSEGLTNYIYVVSSRQSTTPLETSRTVRHMAHGDTSSNPNIGQPPGQSDVDADDRSEEQELAELRMRAERPDPWAAEGPPKKTRKKTKKPRPRGYRRPPSRTPAGLQREAKDRLAVEMRSEGSDYDEIAEELGLANRGVAYKMVQRGLGRYETASALNYFCLELLRVEALSMECDRRILAGGCPSDPLMRTTIEVLNHKMALMGFWAASGLPDSDLVELPSIQIGGLLDDLDRLALDGQWPEHARGLEVHRIFKTLEAGHRIGSIDQAAADIQQVTRDESIALKLQHADDDGDIEYIEDWFGLTRKEIIEAADRHASRETKSVTETYRRREQAGLRRIELDQFALVMSGEWSRSWERQVAMYLRASRGRCKLLGLFHDPRRRRTTASTLPMSPDVEAEVAETTAILVNWRRHSLRSATEAV
jgi:hypothetical protein